jgi:integrase
MARTVRDTKLDTREGRLKLKKGKRYSTVIHDRLALVYRRPGEGSGSWSYRLRDDSTRHYPLRRLGAADDYADATGRDVLTFKQAQLAAIEREKEAQRDDAELNRALTVEQAADDYLKWFRAQRKGIAMAESAIRAHIKPAFGQRPIASLKTKELRDWLDRLAEKPARLRTGKFAKTVNVRAAPKSNDEKRARRATANRILNVMKAILNRAFAAGTVADDSAWRKAKPFKKADEARIRYLTDAESVRLVNACPADLRALLRAALLTGARWGELASLRVADVNTSEERPTMYVAESKSGRPRHIPLNAEGRELFADRVTGKVGEDLMFVRADGKAWGHNHHVRALNAACKVAKVRPAVAFHELRHTYASHLAQAGVPLLTISKLLGHADTRITARHYAHLTDKTLADAVTNLPSFEPNKQSVVTEVPTPRAA